MTNSVHSAPRSAVRPSLSQLIDRKASAGELFMTRAYRYPGGVLAWIYSRMGLTPNGVTLLSGAMATAGAVLLMVPPLPDARTCVIAFLLQVLGYATDCSDGQLARATNQCSRYGQWLDHVMDTWKLVIINCALGWAGMQIARQATPEIDSHWPFVAMSLNLAANMLYFFGWNFKVMLTQNSMVASQLTGSKSKLARMPLQFTEFGIFLFIFLTVWTGPTFIWIYLAYGLFSFGVCAMYLAVSAWYFSKRPAG